MNGGAKAGEGGGESTIIVSTSIVGLKTFFANLIIPSPVANRIF